MKDTNQTHEPGLLTDGLQLPAKQDSALPKDRDLEKRLAVNLFTTDMYRELIANNLSRFTVMYRQAVDLYGRDFLVYSNPSREALSVFSFFNLDRVLRDPSQHHDEIERIDQWLNFIPNSEILTLNMESYMAGLESLLTPQTKWGMKAADKISRVLDMASTPEQQKKYNEKINEKLLVMLYYSSEDFAVDIMRQRQNADSILSAARKLGEQLLSEDNPNPGAHFESYTKAFKILRALGLEPNWVQAAQEARETIYQKFNDRATDHYQLLGDVEPGVGLKLDPERLAQETNKMLVSGHYLTAARMAKAMKIKGYNIGEDLSELAGIAASAIRNSGNFSIRIVNKRLTSQDKYAIRQITARVKASMGSQDNGNTPYHYAGNRLYGAVQYLRQMIKR